MSRSGVRKHIVLALVLSGCTGLISGPGGGDDAPPDRPDEPRDVCATGERDIPGPRLLRRLTSDELTAGVRDAFELAPATWAGALMPADPAGRNGFTNNVDRLVVDPTYAAALLANAKEVAGVITQPAELARVLPCAQAGGESCAAQFLDVYGRRLYRRPLSEAERGRYLALHGKIAGEADFTTWVYWATVGMLQSPHFVYRSELGAPVGDHYELDGYEIATALAFDLTGRPPSDALLDMAAAGGLSTPEQIQAAARDLVLDAQTGQVRPEFRAVFLRFADAWLGLSTLANLAKSMEAFPAFGGAVLASMGRETEAFLAHVVLDQRGGVDELLTSPVTFLDATLAQHYGFGQAQAPGAELVAVERPAGQGVGLLAQGSLLTINAGNTYTSPTKRGVLVRERVLCGEVPPPPPVVGDLPQPTGGETTRDRYEKIHAGNDSCGGCHALFDPIGFGLEHFDATGRWRETENGLAIDDSGTLRGFGGEDIPFQGPGGLAAAVAARPEAPVCMASYMASYAFGLDHRDSECLVSSLAEGLAGDGATIVDFWIGLASTTHFTRRLDGE